MSALLLVRHGQASFLTDDYDRLSPLGIAQASAVGHAWSSAGIVPDRVLAGTLRRQQETAEAVAAVFRDRGLEWPDCETEAGFDEYPADDIVDRLTPEMRVESPFARLEAEWIAAESFDDRYRTYHRMLRAILERWIAGQYDTDGILSWDEFRSRIADAIDRATSINIKNQTVAVFTSGGVIGTSVHHVLAAPASQALNLHWRVFNAAVTRFVFSGSRISLDGFNDIAHLDDPGQLTYR